MQIQPTVLKKNELSTSTISLIATGENNIMKNLLFLYIPKFQFQKAKVNKN